MSLFQRIQRAMEEADGLARKAEYVADQLEGLDVALGRLEARIETQRLRYSDPHAALEAAVRELVTEINDVRITHALELLVANARQDRERRQGWDWRRCG